jgi:NAD(P)-dependent dehydrogenase (short-subunit alcohol dehydrogenase family)
LQSAAKPSHANELQSHSNQFRACRTSCCRHRRRARDRPRHRGHAQRGRDDNGDSRTFRFEIEETARTIEQSGGRARPFVTDVTDAAAVRKAITEIERTFGCVSLLINNAAIPGPIGPFCETDVEQWWRTLDINLRGVMLGSRAVLPGMIARRKGRIINIGSSALPIAYFSAYATSKAALVRFTETVAAEVKPHGVSTFAMGPGTVRTSMAEHSLRDAFYTAA